MPWRLYFCATPLDEFQLVGWHAWATALASLSNGGLPAHVQFVSHGGQGLGLEMG